MVEGEGLHVFPGFVDPHVHLRTPGREDEEDLESGTRAAAAGGFCRVLAMPNTDPVVDTAPVLRSLQERAAREAVVPVGFLASITQGLAGAELTEMVELAREGAAGFSDDGCPVADARRMRQALQYQRLAGARAGAARGGPGAVRRRRDARGRGLDAARPGRHPVDLREHAIERDAALARYEGGRIHILHVSAAESVAAIERGRADGHRGHGRGHAAPPGADRRGRPLARPALQDEPAAARQSATARR